MGNAKTVEELLKEKNVTPEEMEALKDIIDECKDREKRIDNAVEVLRNNLEKLVDALELIHKKTQVLLTSVENLSEAIESLYLISLPKERFYRE